jgi:hypothetical protein
LLVDPAMFLNGPHALFCLYQIRYVKGGPDLPLRVPLTMNCRVKTSLFLEWSRSGVATLAEARVSASRGTLFDEPQFHRQR